MIYLRQSTASQEIPLGYFVDSTDGNTEKTGLTIANTDIKLWKSGGTTLVNKNSGGGTHISNGIYYAVLDATDTDTLGSLALFCHVSGALTVRLAAVVLSAAVYDWWLGATAPLMPTVAGRTLDVSAGGEAGIDWANVGSPTTTVGLSGTTIATATTATTVNGLAAGVITAASIAADAITDAKVAADVTIASVTGAVGSVTAGVTVTTNNDKTGYSLSGAAVQAIWDALTSALTTVGSIGKRLADNLDATVSSRLASASYTTAPTAAANADAVWDEVLSGHLTGGSTGAALNSAGSAGDPWGTALPGAYSAGSAGHILGNRLDAAVTSRMATYTQPTGFLAATFPAGTLANTTNITAGTVTTATNVTTVNGLAADVVNAAALAADAVTEIQAGLATSANQTTILNRLGSFTGSGVNTVLGLFKALLSKTASTPSDVGGTFDPATDSTEALRDRGDSAWATATGFSTLDGAGVRSAVGLASANLDTQLDALPTNAELATALAGADDAVLAAIAALNNLSSAGAQSAAAAALAAYGAAVTGAAMTLTTGERTAVADALLDRTDGVEPNTTVRQSLRLANAANAGKVDGMTTSTVHLRDLADTKNRVTATVDADGNRTAVTRDLS